MLGLRSIAVFNISYHPTFDVYMVGVMMHDVITMVDADPDFDSY
jgi:hypothetical protein